ncbi:MAG: CAP domain-containing protein [Rubrobacteraceae bacterium]
MISKYAFTVFAAAVVATMAAVGSSAIADEKPAALGGLAQKDALTVETCGGKSIELKAEEKKSLDLHNAKRKAKDLKPFCVNTLLTEAARDHARDMIDRDYFAHDSPEGETPSDRLERADYITREFSYWTVGENIAWGSGELGAPDNIFEAWMDSDGHRHNILDEDFRQIGIGMSQGDFETRDGNVYAGSRMYAAEFGARREKTR